MNPTDTAIVDAICGALATSRTALQKAAPDPVAMRELIRVLTQQPLPTGNAIRP